MSTVKIFAEDVVEKIHRYLPGEYDSVQCEVKEVLKNNGIRMTGIEFQREGSSISQIIYLEPFFEDIRQGKTTETVLKNIAVSVGRFSPFRVGLKTPISVNLKSPMHHVCY